MKYPIVLLVALSIFIGISFTVSASDDAFEPMFGEGTHSLWDDELNDFGTTYAYWAQPTTYGWYSAVVTEAEYSSLAFVCYYDEESDRSLLSVWFYLNSAMPFAEESVDATVTIGDNDAIDATFTRWDDNEGIIELYVSGFDSSRVADTIDIGIGPFTFSHDIERLFIVPTASNIIWCDDRVVEEGDTDE